MMGETIGLSVLIGFLIALAGGAVLLPLLRRMQFRQHAYEDAPETHQKKTGTPTMGGILFGLAMLPLLAMWHTPFALALAILVLGCGAVGFIDDYLCDQARTKSWLARANEVPC